MAFTYFFRDRQTLDLIAAHVIPVLKRHMYINIWDAGCAMGPEPYSLAITLRENMGTFLFRNVRIHATDIDESGKFGDVIRRGIYGERGVRRIPPELLTRYFTPLDEPGPNGERRYQISAEMRRAVEYQQHDLLTLRPAREGFGLIVCKNVLLHFSPEQRVAVLKMFHRALADDGFLVTEQTQKLPDGLHGMFSQATSAGQVWGKAANGQMGEWANGRITESRIMNHESRIMNHESRIMNHESRITNYESRITNYESRITNHESRIKDHETSIQHPTANIQHPTIHLDHAFSRVSDYTWMNIDLGGQRIGKVRVQIEGERLVIYSLSIFPEFQGQGYAQQVVETFQRSYATIVADTVRHTARGFWERMAFVEDWEGNYVWEKELVEKVAS